jgi:Ca-activated chloride channel family protein
MYNHLIFDQPRFLFLLFLLIPILFLMIYRYVKQQKLMLLFSQKYSEIEQSFLIRRLNRRYIITSFCFIIFMLLIIFALSAPRWGYKNVTERRRGLDVVFAMDVSRSMNAQDALPSRLVRASLLAQELVKDMPGTRFAVAIAKGSGVLSVPLTDDSEAVITCLNSLSSSVMTSQGTNLESLIRASLSAFQSSSSTQRRIILFSDGETHAGNMNSILQNVQDADVGIISVALGLEKGSPIPVENNVLKKPDGSTVISFLYPELLMNVAERTNGIYIDGNHQDALARLKYQVQLLSSESISSSFRREPRTWWHIFVLLALFAYGLSKWFEMSWRQKNNE